MTLSLTTPTPGGSTDTWGDTLNADLTAIQNAINGLGTLASVTPTGTPNGTKFLRDDGSWQVPTAAASTMTKDATTRTSSFTAAANRIYLVNVSAGNVTATLPAAPADTAQVAFVLTGWTSPFALTVAHGTGDTFADGSTSLSRNLGVGQSVWVQYDATSKAWMPLADRAPIAVLDTRYALLSNLADVATSGFASDLVGPLTLEQLAPGTQFQVQWNGTAWEYAGNVVTSRPTSRTDIYMTALGGASPPAFMDVPYDSWEPDNAA